MKFSRFFFCGKKSNRSKNVRTCGTCRKILLSGVYSIECPAGASHPQAGRGAQWSPSSTVLRCNSAAEDSPRTCASRRRKIAFASTTPRRVGQRGTHHELSSRGAAQLRQVRPPATHIATCARGATPACARGATPAPRGASGGLCQESARRRTARGRAGVDGVRVGRADL